MVMPAGNHPPIYLIRKYPSSDASICCGVKLEVVASVVKRRLNRFYYERKEKTKSLEPLFSSPFQNLPDGQNCGDGKEVKNRSDEEQIDPDGGHHGFGPVVHPEFVDGENQSYQPTQKHPERYFFQIRAFFSIAFPEVETQKAPCRHQRQKRISNHNCYREEEYGN